MPKPKLKPSPSPSSWCTFCFEQHEPTPVCVAKQELRDARQERVKHLKESLETTDRMADFLVDLLETIEAQAETIKMLSLRLTRVDGRK